MSERVNQNGAKSYNIITGKTIVINEGSLYGY